MSIAKRHRHPAYVDYLRDKELRRAVIESDDRRQDLEARAVADSIVDADGTWVSVPNVGESRYWWRRGAAEAEVRNRGGGHVELRRVNPRTCQVLGVVDRREVL
jgi:hypothetical protein